MSRRCSIFLELSLTGLVDPKSAAKYGRGRFLTAIEKAEILELATRDEVMKVFTDYDAAHRFIPYIEMHEFEALLFSNPDVLAEKIDINVSQIQEILEDYNSPEEINDDPARAPSMRLVALKSGYRKVADGKAISEAIGIPTIRKHCAHFSDWLTRLEHLPRISGDEA